MDNTTGYVDELLEVLVRSLTTVQDSTGAPATEGITLCMGGILISGVIVSEKEYYTSNSLLSAIEELGRLPRASKTHDIPPPKFIHLKHVRITGAGQNDSLSVSKGAVWRGRLDRIDGYFLGRPSF